MCVDGWADLLRAFQQQHMGKGAGAGKTLSKFYRVFAVIFIVDGDGGVSHFQRGGEREQDHLNQHGQNQNRAGLRFAQQRLQLFAD